MRQRQTQDNKEKDSAVGEENNNHEKKKTTTRERNRKKGQGGFIFYLSSFIRVLGGILWILICTSVIYIMLPLRALNFIWRSMGISVNNFPLDVISKIWARGIIRMTGAKSVVTTSNKIPTDEATVMLYNHGSFYDPIVLGGYSPIPAKYVFKKELIYLFPFIFLAALVLGHVPINRGKRESAISALQNAAKTIKKLKRTIVIAPEGTRTLDGTMQPFKKGPFHLALDSGVNHVVPVVLHNAHDLWPPGQYLPLPGTIWITYMDPIPTKNETVDSLSEKVYSAMEKEIARINSKKLTQKLSPLGNMEPALAIVLFCSVVGYYLYNWYFATSIF